MGEEELDSILGKQVYIGDCIQYQLGGEKLTFGTLAYIDFFEYMDSRGRGVVQ